MLVGYVTASLCVLRWSIGTDQNLVNKNAIRTLSTLRRLGRSAPFSFLVHSPSPMRIVELTGEGVILQFDHKAGVCNSDPHLGSTMLIGSDGMERQCVGDGMETFRLNRQEGVVVS